MTTSTWTPDSWRSDFAVEQRPDWPKDELQAVTKELRSRPPLIYAGEARALRADLAKAANGEAFVLQAGDCAETFEAFSADRVRDGLKTILQLAAVLTYSAGVPVVKVGRVAGQFAKPRSSPTEVVGDREIPSYRGDMVNRPFPSEAARQPDPENILRAYEQAAMTLNLLRGFTKGGFADLNSVHQWNMEFVASSNEGQRYEATARNIDAALRFMRVCQVDGKSLHEVDFYTSHEALILDYEEALTRQDSTYGGEWYDCSAHMLWVGTRTKKRGGAHVEFLRGVGNPIGCKVDADDPLDHVLWLCETLNPDRDPGRLTLVSRMGADKVAEALPKLIRGVRDAGHPVVWMCDPMHGNTFTSDAGFKTRQFDTILSEVEQYFEAHQRCSSWPGGLHLELTGDDVTECIGGSDALSSDDLHINYGTACDPRLNARQSLDLGFRAAELLQ